MKLLSLISVLILLNIVAMAQPAENFRGLAGRDIILSPVNKEQYATSMGFFCKKELLLEKAIKMPVRIRVGSLDQCNYLEQKPGYSLQNAVK